jgi:hypothetical protein
VFAACGDESDDNAVDAREETVVRFDGLSYRAVLRLLRRPGRGDPCADLDELAADAGMEELPSHGEGQLVVARLSAESGATPGGEVELSIDTSQIKLFDLTGARLAA